MPQEYRAGGFAASGKAPVPLQTAKEVALRVAAARTRPGPLQKRRQPAV